MLFAKFILASSLVNCPQDVSRVITGMKCKDGCKSASLNCNNATIDGLAIDPVGNALWTHTISDGFTDCNGNTVAISIENLDNGNLRVQCARLERLPQSNVVPEISNVACMLVKIEDNLKKCPAGYAVKGIGTKGKRLIAFQCCLIKAPTTIGPVAPVKGLVSVPLGTVVPTATILNGTAISAAPVIGSPLNALNNGPDAIQTNSNLGIKTTIDPTTPNAVDFKNLPQEEIQRLQQAGAMTVVPPTPEENVSNRNWNGGDLNANQGELPEWQKQLQQTQSDWPVGTNLGLANPQQQWQQQQWTQSQIQQWGNPQSQPGWPSSNTMTAFAPQMPTFSNGFGNN